MSLVAIRQAKLAALRARTRLETSVSALQYKLHPSNLAEEAWDGVKSKTADMAGEAVEAVKSRPATVSVVLGAVGLFLARAPLKRAAVRLWARDDDDDEPKE